LKGDGRTPPIELCCQLAEDIDGAYSLVFLDALGNMVVARDPLGIKPLSYALQRPLFAAASESVALVNLGFQPENVVSLPPGQAAVISGGCLEVRSFAPSQHARRAERLSGPKSPRRGAGTTGNDQPR